MPRKAHVKVIVAFDFWRIIVVIERSVGGIFECFNGGRRNVLQSGGHEVARIAEVGSGGSVHLPDEVGPGTDLPLIVKGDVKNVVTRAVIESEVIGQPPFVLQVNAGGQSAVATIGDDAGGRGGGLG